MSHDVAASAAGRLGRFEVSRIAWWRNKSRAERPRIPESRRSQSTARINVRPLRPLIESEWWSHRLRGRRDSSEMVPVGTNGGRARYQTPAPTDRPSNCAWLAAFAWEHCHRRRLTVSHRPDQISERTGAYGADVLLGLPERSDRKCRHRPVTNPRRCQRGAAILGVRQAQFRGCGANCARRRAGRSDRRYRSVPAQVDLPSIDFLVEAWPPISLTRRFRTRDGSSSSSFDQLSGPG
jgi:hypothetical protein